MWSRESLKNKPPLTARQQRRLQRRRLQGLISWGNGVESTLLQWQKTAHRPIKRNYRLSKIFIKNKELAKGLLIDLLFLKLKISDHKRKTSSLLRKLLLKNRNLFTNDRIYNKQYLTHTDKFNLIDTAVYISQLFKIQTRIIFIYRCIKKVVKKLNLIFLRFVYGVFGRLHIYLSRLLFMATMHFIVFVQLASQLIWIQYETVYTHPLWTSIFRVFPFLLPFFQATMRVVSDSDFSLLMLGFYFQIFIVRFKRYKLPRKISYQAGLSFLLMLVGFTGSTCKDVSKVLYKMIEHNLLAPKSFVLLMNDLSFYLSELEALREEKETYITLYQTLWQNSITANVAPFYDAFTLPQLLGIIILFYNCMYFIIKGRKPFIPLVTKAVRRIMVDRNSPESL